MAKGFGSTLHKQTVSKKRSEETGTAWQRSFLFRSATKQLLAEVFVISGIIEVEVGVDNAYRNLIIWIVHCFEENNDKHTFARNLN